MLTDSKGKLDSIWQPGFQPAVQYNLSNPPSSCPDSCSYKFSYLTLTILPLFTTIKTHAKKDKNGKNNMNTF